MARPSESATLYGEKAQFFREIKDEFEHEMGWRPGNAEAWAWLCAKYREAYDMDSR
mgnify:CR=1 FL=1